MNAISLYITTCRYVIQSNPQDPDTWVELYKYLPYLRQALSCCVCTQVFHCPMGPEQSKCQHHVCKECIGGKMRLKPACGWCNNFDTFVEKPQLRIVVQCFKKLCEYIASSVIAFSLASSTTSAVGTVSGNQLLSIIQEAVGIKGDNTNVPSVVNNVLSPPKLHKVDSSTESVSNLPIVCNYMRQARRFRRKRKSRFARPTINKKLCVKSMTKESDNSSPTKDTVDGQVEETNKESSQEDTIDRHLSAGTNSKKKSFISDTVRAEHDYIKEMPVETVDRAVSKPRSRKYSGHGSTANEVSHKVKSKTGSSPKENNGSVEMNHHSTSFSCDSVKSKSQAKSSRSQSYGCRCGLATPKPGNLTCCGQRCPCYSAFKGCENCKCRGCRNPRGDPANNPLAAMRLQRQFHSVHIIQSPLSPLSALDMSPPLLPVNTDLVDDELDINIDI